MFSNGALDEGVGFFPFGGSLNNPLPAVDPTTPFTDGSPALKIVVTGVTGNYSGGAFVASKPRNLSAANALDVLGKGKPHSEHAQGATRQRRRNGSRTSTTRSNRSAFR